MKSHTPQIELSSLLFPPGLFSGQKAWLLTLIAASLFVFRPEEAHGRSYIYFHAHEDDDAILIGGWAYDKIHEAGSTFKLVIATAGETSPPHWKEWVDSADFKDYSGQGKDTVSAGMVNYGYYRMDNTIAGYTYLGLNPTNIIFLGYGCEIIPRLWQNWDTQWKSYKNIYKQSQWTNDAPKYCYGLSYKKSVPYTGNSLKEDIKRILTTNKPDCIMVPDWIDNDAYLCDHAAVSEFVLECLYELREAGGNDWINHVEINYSPATHWAQYNKASALVSKVYNPNVEIPLMKAPWPKDIFPSQMQYFDTLGGAGKQKLLRCYPYELRASIDYTCGKNDLIRGPLHMFSKDAGTQTNFSPMNAVASRGPDCSVQVRDSEAGLNLTVKPQYLYSRDGGVSWRGTPGLKGYYENRSRCMMMSGKEGPIPALAVNNYGFWQTTNLTATLSRVDPTINFPVFNPGSGISNQYCAAEWVGWIKTPAASGVYEFSLDASAQGFVWVNNKKTVWDHQAYNLGTLRSGTIALEGNTVYPIHVGYCNYDNAAPGCKLFWKTPGGSLEIIPSTNLLCGECSVADAPQGTTNYVTVTAAGVPFNQDSLTNNKIKFMSLNMAGTMAEGDVHTVMTGASR